LGGPEWLNELGSWITNNSYKPITNTAWVHARLCKLQKGGTRLAATSDKVAHGRWFSPASSRTKTGRHDIAEILLKVTLNTKNQINQICIQNINILCGFNIVFLSHIFFLALVQSGPHHHLAEN
jgi:hypothetical protein